MKVVYFLAVVLSFSAYSVTQNSCPTGFEVLGKLGCIESKQHGQARCIEAIQQCFREYEGRLPSYSEMVAGLTTAIEAELRYEWVDSASISHSQIGSGLATMNQNCGIIHTKNSGPIADVHYNKTIAYRCFVPF